MIHQYDLVLRVVVVVVVDQGCGRADKMVDN